MAKTLGFFALFVPLFTDAVLAQNNTGAVVDLGYAKYRAHYNDTLDINEFLGLPFAAPPIGPLRWKAPQPYAPPHGLNATITDTKRGSQCVQGYPQWTIAEMPGGMPVTGSEDCLVLDIFTPGNTAKDAKLPVLFTIHGGGYIAGNASIIPPYALMRHAKNTFIFVSIQYRLGAYGFVGSKKYVDEGGAANVGLLDQRFAMEWVTIQGGSAGGGSVTSHMMWKGGVEKAPFHAAIADYPWWQQYLREEQLANQFDYLLSGANCSTLTCLRGVSEDTLKMASQASYTLAYANGAYGYGSLYYGPYIDGDLMRDLPSNEFKAGHFTKVPTLVSREGLEGTSFSNQSMTTIEEETADMKKHFPYASVSFIKMLYELYPSTAFNSTFWHRQAWFGDFSINCPTYYIATSLVACETPIFKQVFDAGTRIHGSTFPYLSILNPAADPSINLTLADAMKDWFISFTIHGDPNAQSWSNAVKPVWPDYKTGEVMSINDTSYGPLDDVYYDNSDRCKFFWKNGDMVQN